MQKRKAHWKFWQTSSNRAEAQADIGVIITAMSTLPANVILLSSKQGEAEISSEYKSCQKQEFSTKMNSAKSKVTLLNPTCIDKN